MSNPSHRVYRTVDHCFSFCPPNVAAYAAVNLDTMLKILNHIMAMMLFCDIFLLFTTMGVSGNPHVAINAFLIAFLLSLQTILVAIIVNDYRVPRLTMFASTDFMVGVALGITVGGTILAFVMCNTFRTMSQCDVYYYPSNPDGKPGGNLPPSKPPPPDNGPHPPPGPPPPDGPPPANHNDGTRWLASTAGNGGSDHYPCETYAPSMSAIWFWCSLVFWFNFCSSLLLAMGRQELAVTSRQQHLYQQVNTASDSAGGGGAGNMGGSGNMAQQPSNGGGGGGYYNAGAGFGMAPSFVGDYSTIPEIRQAGQQTSASVESSDESQSLQQQSQGKSAKIMSV